MSLRCATPSNSGSGSGMVVLGALVPLFCNALTIFQISPFPRHDLTPLGLAISSALIAAALFWRDLLDLMPVARNAVVEYMHDGVVVLDSQNRVVDLNPAARTILHIDNIEVLGKPAAFAFAAWSDYSDAYLNSDDFHAEVLRGEDCYADLSIFKLGDQRGRCAAPGPGFIVVRSTEVFSWLSVPRHPRPLRRC